LLYLGQVRNRYEQIKELGAEFLAVSYDKADALAKYKTKTKTPFPLLSDEGSKVIETYDIKNNWEPFHRGVPHPATYIIDKQGIVRFAEVRQNYFFRTKLKTIFEELKKLM
jgi:peroxiredoxin